MVIQTENNPCHLLGILVLLILPLVISGQPVIANQDGIRQSVDKANEFIVKHNIVKADTTCCEVGGDASHDGIFNLGDAVYIINFIFSDGLPPTCPREADLNNDCAVNVADAVYGINCVFKDCLGGPLCAPTHCIYPGHE